MPADWSGPHRRRPGSRRRAGARSPDASWLAVSRPGSKERLLERAAQGAASRDPAQAVSRSSSPRRIRRSASPAQASAVRARRARRDPACVSPRGEEGEVEARGGGRCRTADIASWMPTPASFPAEARAGRSRSTRSRAPPTRARSPTRGSSRSPAVRDAELHALLCHTPVAQRFERPPAEGRGS